MLEQLAKAKACSVSQSLKVAAKTSPGPNQGYHLETIFLTQPLHAILQRVSHLLDVTIQGALERHVFLMPIN